MKKLLVLAIMLSASFSTFADTIILSAGGSITINSQTISCENNSGQRRRGTSADYVKCRDRGYSHDSCKLQDPQYVICRDRGYSHSSCDHQDEGYLMCRDRGYSHESCKVNVYKDDFKAE